MKNNANNITNVVGGNVDGVGYIQTLLRGNGIGAVLARGASGSFLVLMSGTAIALGLNILLARMMGVSQYGIYVYVLAWINVLALGCRLGLPVSLLRFIPAYAANSQWPLLKGIMTSSLKYVLLAGIVVCTISAAFIGFMAEPIGDDYVTIFWIGLLLLPLIALTELRQAALRALKHVVFAELPGSILRPLIIALITLFLFFMFEENLSAEKVMWANLAATLIAFVIGTTLLLRVVPDQIRHVEAKHDFSQWFRVAVPLFLMSLISVIFHQTDLIMIGILLDPDQTGIYAVSARLATFATFGWMAANAIAAPLISELYSKNSHQELQRMITLSARGIMLFAVLVSLLLAFLGEFLLSIFGEAFVVGYLPLLVLLVGHIFSAFAGSSGYIMTMTGHQKQAAIILTISAITNIILNAILISVMGTIGAAIATSISVAMLNLSMLLYVWRNLRINPTAFVSLRSA